MDLLASAAAAREAAAREHEIARQLQLSLLPERWITPDHLRIATFYQAGVEGAHIGGDWYDVIELGADRSALVIGDVMGRGVRAAAIMAQLRASARAYARLDMRPADVLELLDGVVRDLGEDQLVTCLYAVYDPGDRTLTFANAGHLPPLLVTGFAGAAARRLHGAAAGHRALHARRAVRRPVRPGDARALHRRPRRAPRQRHRRRGRRPRRGPARSRRRRRHPRPARRRADAGRRGRRRGHPPRGLPGVVALDVDERLAGGRRTLRRARGPACRRRGPRGLGACPRSGPRTSCSS